MTTVVVAIDDPRADDVRALLRLHREDVLTVTPPENVYALPAESLVAPGVVFFAARIGGDLAGIGALREIDPTQGEVKSMRTAPGFLRRGVGRAVLDAILSEARKRGYTRLSLETGAHPHFAPAHDLYRGAGFVPCGAFGAYLDDPNSVFMTLRLSPDGTGGPGDPAGP